MTLREFRDQLKNKKMSDRLIRPTSMLLFASNHTLVDNFDKSLSFNNGKMEI